MTTEKFTFLKVLEKYLIYFEAFGQYNQLDEEDRKIIAPYIDHLKQQWQEELKYTCRELGLPSMSIVRKLH